MRLFFTLERTIYPSEKGNKDIAEAIINLAMSKTQSRVVLISGITMRKDKHQNKSKK